jgi:hypothetical protein
MKDLKKGFESHMTDNPVRRFDATTGVFSSLRTVASVAMTICLVGPAPFARAQSGVPQFEVASIRQWVSGAGSDV